MTGPIPGLSAERDVRPPADARDPDAWIAGHNLRTLHHRDPDIGQCVNCGHTDRHCPYWLLGWEISRQALADPATLPVNPPS